MGSLLEGVCVLCVGILAASLIKLGGEEYEWGDKLGSLGWILGISGFALGAYSTYSGDKVSGAIYTLYPEVLDVTLSRIEDIAESKSLKIDIEEFQNIKWIRTKGKDSREKK